MQTGKTRMETNVETPYKTKTELQSDPAAWSPGIYPRTQSAYHRAT